MSIEARISCAQARYMAVSNGWNNDVRRLAARLLFAGFSTADVEAYLNAWVSRHNAVGYRQ